MITKREFYINGAWVPPLAPKDCPVIDPSTEEACAVISLGSAADTDAACEQLYRDLTARDASIQADAAEGRGRWKWS